ncbi:VOC family protein [Actinoplanes sp. HUAS TT8]|uniref:VOC family protein n=1 Tax=Actinoplanes sp. HUAS TT8 TaxID=3447453 RepID=UPI003F520E3B
MPIRTITVPVKNLDAAKALYTKLLGTEPYADAPYYVGFRPESGPELGLDPHGDVAAGPVVFWHVDDIKAEVDSLLAAGATEEHAIRDVGGPLIATLRDPDGNRLGLYQAPTT